ncbi:MAG: 16S rRNA (uracil(1498)-N(3))-methyltransferase [Clostridia bacterium]|nr:16S rRNA (uracil(1498)-N(3))-methyltransferase [Clostridia bacterium]
MHRFYADERGVVSDTAYLCEEDARHATRVLRMKPGEACELFADGRRFSGEIAAIGEDGVQVHVTGEMPSTEPRLRITLYQGLPKADKMELIVQKSVELGAAQVVPVAMSRCVVQLDGKDGRKKQERWQKIAREACKQSGRCEMLQVTEPISFRQLLAKLPEHGAAIVPWEDARGYSLARFHLEHPEVTDLAIVIGPEGGMSEDEIARMKEANCLSVTLGPRILRTETAGLCAMSALFCLYGDME